MKDRGAADHMILGLLDSRLTQQKSTDYWPIWVLHETEPCTAEQGNELNKAKGWHVKNCAIWATILVSPGLSLVQCLNPCNRRQKRHNSSFPADAKTSTPFSMLRKFYNAVPEWAEWALTSWCLAGKNVPLCQDAFTQLVQRSRQRWFSVCKKTVSRVVYRQGQL